MVVKLDELITTSNTSSFSCGKGSKCHKPLKLLELKSKKLS